MVCDLSNEMTLIGDWDLYILFSPIQPKIPTPVYIDSLVPLASARAMTVKIPTTSLGCSNFFLDDIIKVFLDRLSIFKNKCSFGVPSNVCFDESTRKG